MESRPPLWYELRMHGVMSPPQRYPSRPLMLATGTPHHPPRGLMSTEAAAFAGFDLHFELKRLLWMGVAVLALVLYLSRIAR
jgi:hypothetical protein